MNLYHLKYFLVLAKNEHFTKSAKELNITQPTLSYAMNSLEKELGIFLFEKDGRNVTLTKWGKEFAKDVERSLKILDDSIQRIYDITEGAGHIDIGLLRTISNFEVPHIVREFINDYGRDDISFSFYNDSGLSKDLLEGVVNQKYDVSFCTKIPDYQEDLEFLPFSSKELVLITPPDHPLTQLEEVSLEAINQYPQIRFSPSSGMRAIIDRLFDESGLEVNTEGQYEVNEDETIAGLVAEGFGVAILDPIPILDTLPIAITSLNHPNSTRMFYMAYKKDRELSPFLEAFVDFVEENCYL